jgi:hypothetical protein
MSRELLPGIVYQPVIGNGKKPTYSDQLYPFDAYISQDTLTLPISVAPWLISDESLKL